MVLGRRSALAPVVGGEGAAATTEFAPMAPRRQRPGNDFDGQRLEQVFECVTGVTTERPRLARSQVDACEPGGL